MQLLPKVLLRPASFRLKAMVLLAGFSCTAFGFAQMPHMPQIPGLSGASASSLSDSQVGAGVKDALSVGTKNAVRLVAKPGGYLDNAAIKILLPPSLHPVEQVMRAAGQGPKIDAFVDSMNHAAESAAPEAENIFADAVRSMTIEDARALLNGGNTSITDYFKKTTSASLATAFRPHVETAMQANGVTQQYQALAARMPSMPFLGSGGSSHFDINTYVVNKALDGLFYMLAQQEKDIRSNPAARSTALLKQVFGQ